MQTINFQQDVIERSFEKPVVVDFWAEWCGPCRILGPVIEKIAEEQTGKWELVKVDTEENQEAAYEYGIRSIPNVKMFHKGEVVAEFAGAIPRNKILEWLDEHLPNEDKTELADLLAQEGKLSSGEMADQLKAFLSEHGDVLDARVALARHLVITSPKEALALIRDVRMGDSHYTVVEDIRVLASFFDSDFIEVSPVAEALQSAKSAFQNDQPEEGIKKIIDANMHDKNYGDDLPRKTAIAFFRLWGSKHELTQKYRKRFEMMLY